MNEPVAVDTSVSIAMLVRSHPQHELVWARVGNRQPRLTGHSLAETYAVLTRLPGDARVAAGDAARMIDIVFGPPVLLSLDGAARLAHTLSLIGVLGGAVYDGLVALAAREHNLVLMTRDQRAVLTYGRVGVVAEVLASAEPR